MENDEEKVQQPQEAKKYVCKRERECVVHLIVKNVTLGDSIKDFRILIEENLPYTQTQIMEGRKEINLSIYMIF